MVRGRDVICPLGGLLVWWVGGILCLARRVRCGQVWLVVGTVRVLMLLRSMSGGIRCHARIVKGGGRLLGRWWWERVPGAAWYLSVVWRRWGVRDVGYPGVGLHEYDAVPAVPIVPLSR